MNDKEYMQGIINDIDKLIANECVYSSPEFKKWHYKTERFIMSYFGDSPEYRRWIEYYFGQNDYLGFTPYQIKNVLLEIRSDFEVYLEELEKDEQQKIIPDSKETQKNYDNKKVFIVHGHDGELKEAVARLVEKQGIDAIILSEKANCGKTIIEKIERYSEVGAAICLFTNDDEGKEKNEKENKPRARQNVVLETGFFIGHLGRERVVILSDSNNDIPGDLSGVVYTNTSNWKSDLGKELEEMDYQIDYKKLFQ